GLASPEWLIQTGYVIRRSTAAARPAARLLGGGIARGSSAKPQPQVVKGWRCKHSRTESVELCMVVNLGVSLVRTGSVLVFLEGLLQIQLQLQINPVL